MASVTLTGSYSGSNASNYGIRCVCSSTSNGSVANTSDVTVKLQMRRAVNTGYEGQWNELDATGRIIINGNDSGTSYVTFDTRNTTNWITLKTYTVKGIKHNDNGAKSITIKAYFEPNATSTLYGGTVSGTFTLDTIPRYATSVQSLKSKTETAITMNWSSDSTIDYIWYSKDNGSNWTGINVTDGKSGTYTISGLSTKTAYKIKTRVRRKDSQLTTDSSALSVETYGYPYCINMPNFILGNEVTIRFYNPLGRSIKWQLIGADGSAIEENTTTKASWTGINSRTTVDKLYKSIPDAPSGTYKVKVTYGSSTITKTGGTYSVKGTEVPVFGTIFYADTNNSVVAITGHRLDIVQNQSDLQVTYTPATASDAYSTIKKHTFELNGVTKIKNEESGTVDFGKIDSAKDLTLTVTVTDSRGLSSKLTRNITMLEHSNPTAIVTLERLNNYEDETYLTVDGSISSINGNNTMAIKYRYKPSGGSYGDFVSIEDKKTQTLSLDKNISYIFNVVVIDAFGSKHDEEYVLNKGVFPFFIDVEKNSLGMNALPTGDNVFEMDGYLLENRREFSIPTNGTGSATFGWYLAFSGSLSGYANKGIMLAIQQTYSGGSGILYMNIRSDNSSTLRVPAFHWLTYTTIPSANFAIKTDGNNFYFYVKTTVNYQQYYIKVLQEKLLNSKQNYATFNINTPAYDEQVEETEVEGATNPTSLEGRMYPVGSVIATKTKTNPSATLGGTWVLVDKEFESSHGNDSSTATKIFTSSTTALTVGTNRYSRGGHSIRVQLNITYAGKLTDSGLTLGTINLNALGLTNLSFAFTDQVVYSDDANGGIAYSINNSTGVVTLRDVFGTQGSSHKYLIDFTAVIYYANMLDDYCNKFYWERTA